jgi:hypothetical protein
MNAPQLSTYIILDKNPNNGRSKLEIWVLFKNKERQHKPHDLPKIESVNKDFEAAIVIILNNVKYKLTNNWNRKIWVDKNLKRNSNWKSKKNY